MEWIPYGPRAVLIRFADRVGDQAFALGRTLMRLLEADPPPGLVEVVPAFTSLLLEFDASASKDLSAEMPRLRQRLSLAAPPAASPERVVTIEVVYDGPDLERVASLHGLTVDEVARLHAEPLYKVYMLGFSPGFPYLGDLDKQLHTPRLDTPRRQVSAGSVAIGGEHTGIYSIDCPGGWNLIGRTRAKVFDPNRVTQTGQVEDAFLLHPGDRVKFVARAGPA